MQRNPKETITLTGVQSEIGNSEKLTLLVGQKLAAGTANAYETNLGNAGQEDTLFGAGSILAGMTKGFKGVNKKTRVDAIALTDNPAGTAATGHIILSEKGGTTNKATKAGTAIFWIGDKTKHKYSVSVAVDQAITGAGSVSEALNALIAADTNAPCTTAVSTGDLTLTHKHKGTVGNDLTINASGFSYDGTDYVLGNIKVALTKFSGGATDPVLTGVLDAIGDQRYQTIVIPNGYDVSVFKTLLDTRFNKENAVLDGVVLQPIIKTLADAKSYTTAINSQSVCILDGKIIDEALHKGVQLTCIPYSMVSEIAGIRSLRLTDGASISDFVSTTAPVDQFGGMHTSTLPYFNTPISGEPMNVAHTWSEEDIDELVAAGGFVITNNASNTGLILSEVVTTYRTDSVGIADTTFKYLNYVDASSTAREYYFNNYKKRYVVSRLTGGAVQSGIGMENAESIATYSVLLFRQLGEMAVVQYGSEANEYYVDNLSVATDLELGKATVSMILPIVTQLRIINVPMQIGFNL